MGKLAAIMMALLFGSAMPAYQLDPAASAVSAKVGFMGLSSKTANFPAMSGQIRLDPDDSAVIDLRVDLDARQLTASDRLTERRLKGEKYFWVERHPTISFRGTTLLMDDDRTGRIEGSITARGVTRPVSLDVEFTHALDRIGQAASVGIEAETTIDRRDFGMTSHGLVVGKKVDIRITARMVPEA